MILWDMKEEDLKGSSVECIHTNKKQFGSCGLGLFQWAFSVHSVHLFIIPHQTVIERDVSEGRNWSQYQISQRNDIL